MKETIKKAFLNAGLSEEQTASLRLLARQVLLSGLSRAEFLALCGAVYEEKEG